MDEMKDRVKRRRRELELTQKQLAGRCGVKQQNIQQIESGVVRNPSYILELAKGLEVSADWLVNGAGIADQQQEALSDLWRELSGREATNTGAGVEFSASPSYGVREERTERAPDSGARRGENVFAESAATLQKLTDMIQKVDPQVRDGLIEMVSDYLSNPEKNRRKLFYIQSIIAAAASDEP